MSMSQKNLSFKPMIDSKSAKLAVKNRGSINPNSSSHHSSRASTSVYDRLHQMAKVKMDRHQKQRA